jgi:hypothetical protein
MNKEEAPGIWFASSLFALLFFDNLRKSAS